jgi:hypothetical protein
MYMLRYLVWKTFTLVTGCYQIKFVDGYMYIEQPNASSGIRSCPTPGGIKLCSVRAIVATVPSCISATLSQQTTTLTSSEQGAPWLLDHVLHLFVLRVVPSHVWSQRRLLVAERATDIEMLLSLPVAGKRT